MENEPDQAPDRVPTRKLFQTHREEIKKMYLYDKMSLRKVMEHMERKGLQASYDQWRHKIAEWRLVKVPGKTDLALMANIERHRATAGKETLFYLNGKKYPRFLDSSRAEESRGTPLPPGITYRTPSPKLDPLQLPDDQYFTAIALQWFDQQEPRAAPLLDHKVIRAYRQGLKFFSKNDSERGRHWTQEAFQNIPKLLVSPSPDTLLVLMITALAYGDSTTYKRFWEDFNVYTRAILGEGQYLRRLSATAIKCFSSMEVVSHKKLLSEALTTVIRKNSSLCFSIHHFPKSIFSPLLKSIWHLPFPGSPTGLESQLSDTPSLEAVLDAPIPPGFSPMENLSYRTGLLSCWGQKLGWHIEDICTASLKLPDRIHDANAEDALLLNQHVLMMASMNNKARYDLNPAVDNARFEMAI